MNRLHQTYWGLVVGAGLCIGATSVHAAEPSGVIRDADWSIEIRPAAQPVIEAGPATGPQVIPTAFQDEAPALEAAPAPIGPELPMEATPTTPSRMSYAQAYAAIPFSRTEYEANPTYRHQAALELMFGVMRSVTLIQQYTPHVSRYGDTYQVPYGRSDTQHINIRHFGGGYYSGQSPFGYPYGLKGNW